MYIQISKPKRISLAAGVDHFILVLLKMSQRIVATGIIYGEIYKCQAEKIMNLW